MVSVVPGSPRNLSLTLSVLMPFTLMPSMATNMSPAFSPAFCAGMPSYGSLNTVVFLSVWKRITEPMPAYFPVVIIFSSSALLAG